MINGKFIQDYRKRLGVSRAKFGKMVGYSEAHIYKMERGDRKVPQVLKKLLEILIKKKPSEEG